MSDPSYSNLSDPRRQYVDSIVKTAILVGIDITKTKFTRTELRQVSMVHKKNRWVPKWITHDHDRRAGVGVYNIPEVLDRVKMIKSSRDEIEDFASKYGQDASERLQKIWRFVDAQ